MFGHFTRSAVLVAALALAACDTAEERAEEHYQSSIELLESGDTDRALVELRNVFQLNPEHLEAREAYAGIMRDRGNMSEAYASYLRVVESQPDNLVGRQALAEMAILRQDWEEAQRHGAVVVEAQADTIETRIIDLGLRYRNAAEEEDDPTLFELAREAQDLYAEAPESDILRRILIEGYAREGDIASALPIVDDGLARDPDDERLNVLKLRLLTQLEDPIATEDHLRQMIERFPENDRVKQALVRLLLAQGEPERAEEFMRGLVAEGGEFQMERVVTLVTFLRQTQGNEAALAELESAIANNEDTTVLQALRASLIFDRGDRDDGIAAMQAAIDAAPDDDTTNQLRVSLAKMLETQGNETGARELVDQVLEGDGGNQDALKMKARWLIADDRADEAVNTMRQVLDQAPEDAEAMTIMADAHARNGNPELSQDLLSLAVEASGNGRDESLRFAALLIEQRQYRPAEDVLVAALRQTPGDLRLLQALAGAYLGLEDYSRATGVEEALRRIDTDEALLAADGLKLSIIARQQGGADAIQFLEGLAAADDATVGTRVGLLRARLSSGDREGALALAEELLAENPDSPSINLVMANTRVALGDLAEAETIFRSVIDDTGGNDRIWLQLLRIVNAQGRTDEARTLTDEGLERFPDSSRLKWAKASTLEQTNQIDEAIAIYEDLYETDSTSPVIANNLASLLATYRDDDESLNRAWDVARRLRGTEVAPFQDTYGWIAFRRGNVDEALEYLEPAAARLTSDPIVQFHLATALEAANRPEDALAAFQRAVEIAGDDDTRDQIAAARAAIERLGAGGAD